MDGVADLIRDTFKRGKCQGVILPLTVLPRLDCVLAPTREDVLQRQAELFSSMYGRSQAAQALTSRAQLLFTVRVEGLAVHQ